ncbi:hypothetical protein [Testudinibacter aquarius]|uniref:PRD domain-containing protein n=1 Tax=Testudinibacter aquarius TaxID=1524974 RepID=A0A4R3XWG7_9PAST|nr:hypothetical protein [Testudinibacter aquarius]KAE9528290.1 hypothetical protein A1D24_10300 [Testudinibacter aquarius]TCV83656.1 hypothetical protein EDC16_11422 [Testudinibacter aquarius]TNG91578.1 hypothetical protein FHQ21_07280 [Testudinibacter aquarius]
MQRFDLLKNANLINSAVYQIIYTVKNQFKQWQLDCETPQVEMLLTHLAMALMRLINHTPEQHALTHEVLTEIESSEHYQNLMAHHQIVLGIIDESLPDLTIPAAEESYLIANLYSLMLAQPQCFQPSRQKSEA